MREVGFRWFFVFGALLGLSSTAHAGLTAQNLRCEYKRDPLGIDMPHPRLFWTVTGNERRERQSAYRILVASTPERLYQNRGDLWDTGKVASSETIQLPYNGKPLRSSQQVFWKVRVWNRSAQPSAWSAPATWTVGLPRPQDWTARWVAGPKDNLATLDPTLGNANWIWFAGDDAEAPVATRYFQHTWELPAGVRIGSAMLAITADDAYDLALNNRSIGTQSGTDSWRAYHVYDVRKQLHAGANTITIRTENEEKGPAGLIAHLVVTTAEGRKLVCDTDGQWQAASDPNGAFTPVRVIGPYGVAPWGQVRSLAANTMTAPPYFRKTFKARKPVRRALLYATALGVYELSLNGRRVGNDVLSPGWTDYRKRVHYLAYDVTKLVRPGKNALGAILGDGWYASYLAFTGKRHFYGGDPALRLQLAVEYSDGTRETVGTNDTWTTRTGPLRYADLLMGTTIDTRQEMPGWDTIGGTARNWRPARVVPAPKLRVEAQPNEPIRSNGQVVARSRTRIAKGVYVYDLGQNLVGWVRLTVTGKPGQTIRVRHGERLNPDGSLYTANLRSARATDTYILKGGTQTLEPSFTFHGFQYVEISGDAPAPLPAAVVGVAASSDLKPTIAFASDDPLLNRLVRNIDWGFRGNSLDVPTDCPQRDERAGWTADAQVFAKTAMFHRDAGAFYTKWMSDVRDGQFPNGSYPDVAPSILGGGNAAWEDAGVITVYRLWEMYGDTHIVRESWPSLLRYMAHLAKVAPDGIRAPGAYGDWLLLAGPGYSAIHGTAYYYRSADLMARMAAATGRTEDAARFRELREKIRDAFVQRFVSADGRVRDDNQESQTFYALALEWHLMPEALRPQAAAHLVRLIGQQNNHLSTGFIGTPILLPALASAGHTRLANDLLLTDTYPSWLYQVKLGATTMWERWDGWTPAKGFQDVGMNSFNHYWLGCVGEWMYSGVGGIDTAGPGWSRITIRPQVAGKLKRARVRYDSLRGPVVSEWTKEGSGRFTLNVSVPANTTATVTLPATLTDGVTESGKPVAAAVGVTLLHKRPAERVFAVQSGQYRFQVTPRK